MTRLGPNDAVLLHMDRADNRMMVTGVLRFAGPVSREAARHLVTARLVEPYPRFGQRVVPPRHLGGRPRWEEVTDFDLDAHLQFERLAAPADEAALQARASALMSQGLPRDRPLWQITMLEGLRGEGGEAAALVVRIHHCIADGMALARVLLGLSDEAAADLEPPPRAKAWPGLVAGVHRLGRTIRAAPELPGTLGHLLSVRANSRTQLRGPLGEEKRALWTPWVPLERIKAIGRAHGATVNDVLLAATTGCLRRWLLDHGDDAAELRVYVPVDLRPAGAPVPRQLGNRVGMVMLSLPVGIAEPTARLAEVKRRMDGLKHSIEPIVVFGLLSLIGLAPPQLERLLLRVFTRQASGVVTNVAGPRQPLHFAGVEVDGIWFWVPQAAHVPLGVSIFSYAGRVSVGIAADALRVPDPAALARPLLAELEALERASPGSGPAQSL